MSKSVTIKQDVELDIIECAACGTLFGVTVFFVEQKRNNHTSFFCPNGHSNYFPQESEEEKLRRILSDERAKLANAQLEIIAAEKKVKRLERRAKNGVCPCCHRQFVQLTRHMKSKHPEFSGE